MDMNAIFGNWAGGKKPVDNSSTNSTGQNGGDNKTDNKNDGDGDSKIVNDVWQQTKAADNSGGDGNGNNGGNGSGNNNGNNGNGNNQPDPQQMIKDHLKSVGLDPIVFSDEDKEAIKNGTFDWEGYTNRVNKKFEDGYINVMKNVNTLVDNKVQKALQDANKNTTDILEGVQLKSYLENGIPYIKGNQILGPVAETAFKRFYNHPEVKQNKERALELTKRFLTETANTVNENNPDLNFSRSSFRGNPADHRGDTDWLKAFRGEH